MHEHKKCEHKNLKYCEKCDVVYCEDCKKEWGNDYYKYSFNTIPIDISGTRTYLDNFNYINL